MFSKLIFITKCNLSLDSQEVLNAMRNYVHNFFGCRACAEHFESMARESLVEVNTWSSAVLWLWSRHNQVNSRLAGRSQCDCLSPACRIPLVQTRRHSPLCYFSYSCRKVSFIRSFLKISVRQLSQHLKLPFL